MLKIIKKRKMSYIDFIIATFLILILILLTVILVILNDFKEEIWERVVFPKRGKKK